MISPLGTLLHFNAPNALGYLVCFPCDWKTWKGSAVDFPDPAALASRYALLHISLRCSDFRSMWKRQSRYHSSSEEDHLWKNVQNRQTDLAKADEPPPPPRAPHYADVTQPANTTFAKPYLAWTIVSVVDCCSRTAGICSLAVASSSSRGSAHLRGLSYVSSENKRQETTPELSATEGNERRRRGRKKHGDIPTESPLLRRDTRTAHPGAVSRANKQWAASSSHRHRGVSAKLVGLTRRIAPRYILKRRRADADAARNRKPGSRSSSRPRFTYSVRNCGSGTEPYQWLFSIN